jgi:ribosomal protein S27E
MTPEEQKKILDNRVPAKKVRCKNWPSCKDPNCIFAHPTETVSFT